MIKVALWKLVVAKFQSVVLVCSSVQQLKNTHSTVGAFEKRLFVFLLEPEVHNTRTSVINFWSELMLILVVLLANYQYKIVQVSKALVEKSH